MRKQETREEILINSVKEAYLDFIDFVENPGKHSGYMAIIYKSKPQSRELIKATLLDIKIRTEKDLIRARNRMRRTTGYYNTKDGT